MRDELNDLVNCLDNSSAFEEYIKLSVATSNNSLGEDIEALPLEHFVTFSEKLFQIISENVADVDSSKIHAAVTCIRTIINRNVPLEKLLKCVSLIHGNLLSFTEESMYVQNVCSHLLEEWWLGNHPERGSVAANVPFYLLSRVSSAVGKVQDVKRLNQVKETLELVESDSFKSISSLISLAATNPLTIKCVDGVEFLAYALTNSPCLMKDTHTALKSAIPGSKQLAKIGEVYYRAVELADARGILETYSSTSLQDLAKSALHCHRTGPSMAAQDVLKVLSVLHKHKKEPKIENTLYGVYSPLLWRALDLPNGEVRANAASLLLDIFPLIQSPCPVVQLDEALNAQCAKIQEVLNDEDEGVRVCAVRGTAKVLDRFWELLPAHHLMGLLTTLSTQLPFDTSSPTVVATTLQGLQLLLNNPLCHAALRKVLPPLKDHIYHPSPAVRSAMVSLLETLHQTRIMKFWDLVPAEDLLSLVEGSNAQLRPKLVSLLTPLYLPSDADLPTLIPITMSLLEEHPSLHRVLYPALYGHVGMGPSLRLGVGLLGLVRQCAQQGQVSLSGEGPPLIASATDRIAQLLEVSAILLHCSSKDAGKNSKAAGWLCSKVIPLIPELMERYGGDRACGEALSVIIGSLPEEGLEPLEELCFSQYHATTNLPVKTSLCRAILRMGATSNLIDTWTESISNKLQGILKGGVAKLGANPIAQTGAESSLHVLVAVLSSDEQGLLLQDESLSSLYCTLLSSGDVVTSTTTLRPDAESFLALALSTAARLTPHLGSSQELLEIAECLHTVVVSKSRIQLRALLLKGVLPPCVEGFQVLPFSAPLLELLYQTLSLLTEEETHTHRLSLAKFLYRAGALLGTKPNYDVNLVELFEKVLRVVQCNPAVNRKTLQDVESLLLEMAVTAQKQNVTSTKQQPWSDVPRVLVELITGDQGEVIPSLLAACCTGSASFKEWLLPTLESASVEREDVREFLSTI